MLNVPGHQRSSRWHNNRTPTTKSIYKSIQRVASWTFSRPGLQSQELEWAESPHLRLLCLLQIAWDCSRLICFLPFPSFIVHSFILWIFLVDWLPFISSTLSKRGRLSIMTIHADLPSVFFPSKNYPKNHFCWTTLYSRQTPIAWICAI